jgi:hypothetical protein
MADVDLKDALDNTENLSAGFQGKQVPAGGATGQRLQKAGVDDGNTEWGDDPDYSEVYAAKNHDHEGLYIETETDPVAMEAIGTRTYTEQNVVTNSEAIALSIDALDIAMGTVDAALAAIIGEDIDSDI